MKSEVYNIDCLEYMRGLPDKHFDLVIADPPYGINIGNGLGSGKKMCKMHHKWQYNAPGEEFFNELFRISKEQIIWGGNYFDLPPTRCFLVWRKTNVPLEGFTMSAAEYAWTSFDQNAMVFEFSAVGQVGRFHPTQKPPELYRWIYKHFAHEGDKILDTHLGSGSSRIAAYDAGLDFVGYEIDETYFRLQEERFERHTSQMNLFID